MRFQAPKGTHDILPGESERWEWLEARARDVLSRYGYREVRTPMFEATDLFVRSVGESTDIVRKELYSFEDKGGRSLTLRPEGTAPLVRAFLEHSLAHGQPISRLSYLGPMFRYERPQAGRFRQFWQIGAELIGPASPAADAEMIDLFVAILAAVGLRNVTVLLNSLGDATCRPAYEDRIRAYFEKHAESLCGDCKERLKTNPLRILDCKVPSCQPILEGAPSPLDALCDPCREHFAGVEAGLRALAIPTKVVPRLVRGLDYYTRTVFEVHAASLGAQNAVGGGGRYDRLVKDFGGPDTPAIGFSIGMERLLLSAGSAAGGAWTPDVCGVVREEGATFEALALARALRGLGEGASDGDGLRVIVDVAGRSAGAQMKWASKLGARFAVFHPKDSDGYPVRDMTAGKDEIKQETVEALSRWLLERRRESTAGVSS